MKERETILVVRLGSLGDLLLTSSPLINLRLAFPNAHIALLTKERNLEIAGLLPGIDELIPFNRNPLELWPTLDRYRFSHLFDLHGNLATLLMGKGVSADHLFRYHKERRSRWLLTRSRGEKIGVAHTIDRYNEAVTASGASIYSTRPRITIPTDVSVALPNGPYVVIAPGASHTPKGWGRERFARLVQMLVSQTDLSIVWADTLPPEADMSSLLKPIAMTGRLITYQNLPLRKLVHVVRQASIVVANDSGLMHLGSACGTPTIGLFGPTHPALGFSPRGLRDQVLDLPLFCRPCSLHGARPCWRDRQYCFDDLTVEAVAHASRNLVQETERLRPAIFLDRDGTLIVNKHYLSNPADVELVPGVASAIRRASGAGYRMVVVSNQSGVARGLFDESTVVKVNNRVEELLSREGAHIDQFYFCPHHPSEGNSPTYTRPCNCRKPGAGMVESAARDLGIDLKRSWLIGDSVDDLNLACVTGARGLLVATGHGQQTAQTRPRYLVGMPLFASATASIDAILAKAVD